MYNVRTISPLASQENEISKKVHRKLIAVVLRVSAAMKYQMSQYAIR